MSVPLVDQKQAHDQADAASATTSTLDGRVHCVGVKLPGSQKEVRDQYQAVRQMQPPRLDSVDEGWLLVKQPQTKKDLESVQEIPPKQCPFSAAQATAMAVGTVAVGVGLYAASHAVCSIQ
jgi:hypothetical protein